MSSPWASQRNSLFMITTLIPLLLTTACGNEPMMAPAAVALLNGDLPGGALVDKQKEEVPVGGADGLLGNSLPGSWRPFADDSPWNTPIPAAAQVRAGSRVVMAYMAERKNNLRFSREYTIPVWVVNSQALDRTIVRSDRIFDAWDADRDGWSDVGVPLDPDMWGEATSDGHICVVDPRAGTSWEMSRFHWPAGGTPECTTFNIWDLGGSGHGDHNEGQRWQTRGGRGSGQLDERKLHLGDTDLDGARSLLPELSRQ